MCAGLFASTIGNNNDLGWRAVLPGVVVLTVFAAVGLSRWIAVGARAAAAAAIAAWLLGLPDGLALVRENAAGILKPDGRVFAQTPEMWAAVRRHAAPDERVANNPLFLQDLTPWPVNLSWALLSDRRSCFAGRELTLAYTALPRARREEIDAQFIRVFAGDASSQDIEELATRYDCRRGGGDRARRRLAQGSVCGKRTLPAGGGRRPLAHLPPCRRAEERAAITARRLSGVA